MIKHTKHSLWLRYYIYCRMWFSEHAPIWSLTILRCRTRPENLRLGGDRSNSSGVYRLVEVFFIGSFQQSQSLHLEPTYRKIIKDPIQGRRHHQVCHLVENKIWQNSSADRKQSRDIAMSHLHRFPLFSFYNEVTILFHIVRHENSSCRHFMY